MKGVFVNCPDCKKHILIDAYLRPGSFFRTMCPHCGTPVDISCEPGRIIIKLLRKAQPLTDDEEDGIIFMQL